MQVSLPLISQNVFVCKATEKLKDRIQKAVMMVDQDTLRRTWDEIHYVRVSRYQTNPTLT